MTDWRSPNKNQENQKKTKKELCTIFKQNGLNITIEVNKKCVDFLDVTLDLRTGLHKPYKKPNDSITYVHSKSNHPPSIIKNLPKGIEVRLSNNSSNAEIFRAAAKPYNTALKENGHKTQLKYVEKEAYEKRQSKEQEVCNQRENHQNDKTKITRKRKITWFNPPFSKNVTTNIGKTFFALLDTCFPKNNKLHKIINRNTVKLSYSCMNNMKQIIDSHNQTILNKSEQEEKKKSCNCRDKSACPLKGKCLQEGVVYQATVVQEQSKIIDTYIGITENQFKTRYNQHNSSFRLQHKQSATSLSEHIWELKNANLKYTITWSIVEKARPYSPKTKRCNLCLAEKYNILSKKPSLNRRKEIYGTCMHRKKHLLQNFQPTTTKRNNPTTLLA